jgi:Rps23 Pro-64 3,4-dihydroxylase Tpa1-like proline 4-hydroxylase
MAAGRLVVIRDAFVASFAERIHRSLDACVAWQVYERYEKHFHYHHHNLYKTSDYPPDLAWCEQIFGSLATKALATRLSGRECMGPTAVSASWYLPGDHSLPHTDAVPASDTATRQVAFVWHLARDWRSEWGGALFWCPKSLYLPPVFNTLMLFNVGPNARHFVTEGHTSDKCRTRSVCRHRSVRLSLIPSPAQGGERPLGAMANTSPPNVRS